MEAVKALVAAGWTETEARVYLALAELGEATGYELAKRTNLARANVYAALERLERRGAVLRGERGACRSVPFEELSRRMVDDYAQLLDGVRRRLAERRAPGRPCLFGQTHDAEAVLHLARGLLAGARREALLTPTPSEARPLAAAVEAAAGRGVRLRTLCLAGCARPCGACRGQIVRAPQVLPPHTLLLLQDGRAALWADLGATPPAAVYGDVPGLVRWLEAAFEHAWSQGTPMESGDER
ncbi:MAG: hypothetical protein IMW98_05670 [Firmicutes bacterium]|nr:hypothetical protein [Bacillota bacterium]